MKILGICLSILCLVLLFQINGYCAGPSVFFSDLTDAPISGWEGSAVKGAAVSIWGLNLGSSRGTSYITCGGHDLTSDSDYAEWGSTTNPTTARGLQRITFYLNSSMSTGFTTISVTNADGTSVTIPFYTRTTGNIYFVATDGDDSANGTSTSTPWKTPMKARGVVDAGDVVYFRGGTYVGETYRDTSSISASNYCYISFYNGNVNAGEVNNGIAFAAYPGELPIFGDGTDTIPKFIRQANYDPNTTSIDYWVFSKFKVQIYNSVTGKIGGGDDNSADNVRIIGFDATTTAASTGTGVAFWFSGGNTINFNTVFYGNYVHHTGKALNWVFADGSGYRVGPVYFEGFGKHGTVDVGWNEFAYNNGQCQFFGHFDTDEITLLKYHDNINRYTAINSISDVGNTIVFGGGDDNNSPGSNYNFIQTAYIYNNLIYNNEGPVKFADGSYGSHGGDYYVYNNTFYGNSGGNDTIREFTISDLASLIFRNNIVYTNPDASGGWYTSNGFDDEYAVGSNNVWYGISAGLPVWDDSVSSIKTDPLFMDAANYDFRLKSTSPCKDHGADTSAIVLTDKNGIPRPQNSIVDIGAYEYSVASSDVNAPAAITNLSAVTGDNEGQVKLSWTATGDDGTTGTAAAYMVKYSTTIINSDAEFYQSSDVSGEPVPSVSGTPETMTVSGLTGGQRYYFAIKARDEAPNTSVLSNVPSAIAKEAGAVVDNTPPYTTGHIPAENAINIASDANIVVHVKDDGYGVDINTIVMKVNGVTVTPTITGTPADYTLTYDPVTDFTTGDSVSVTVEASDLAP